MSILVTDNNSNAVQAFRLPNSGATTNIATLAAASASSPALAAGVYRVVSTVAVSIASGPVGHIATAMDMPLGANSAEYFYVNAGDIVCAYDAGAGGGVVSCTRMP